MAKKVVSLWAKTPPEEVVRRSRLPVPPEFKEAAALIFAEGELSFNEIAMLFDSFAESFGIYLITAEEVRQMKRLLEDTNDLELAEAQALVNSILVNPDSESDDDLSWLAPFHQLTTRLKSKTVTSRKRRLLGLYFCIIYAATYYDPS